MVPYRGEYCLNHQLSGFKVQGHFTVSGDRITLFNDPECHGPAVDGWDGGGGVLRFELVRDSCDHGGVRTWDLTFKGWVKVNPCRYRIANLWPAEVAC